MKFAVEALDFRISSSISSTDGSRSSGVRDALRTLSGKPPRSRGSHLGDEARDLRTQTRRLLL